MKQKIIILQWKENGKDYSKTLSKDELINLMVSIKTVFYNDNEISSIMVNKLPKVKSIMIDKDQNEFREVPFIYCICDDGKEEIIKINRVHRIMWGIFDKMCSE